MITDDLRNFAIEIPNLAGGHSAALGRYETQTLSPLAKREECDRAIQALDDIIFAAQHAKAEWEAIWHVHDKEVQSQTFNAPSWAI